MDKKREELIDAMLEALLEDAHPGMPFLSMLGGSFASEYRCAIETYQDMMTAAFQENDAQSMFIQSYIMGCVVATYLMIGAKHPGFAEEIARLSGVPSQVSDELYETISPIPASIQQAVMRWSMGHAS